MKKKKYIRDDLFKETIEGVVLLGNRCVNCGRTFYPKAEFCTNCLSKELNEITFSKRGTLYSYTITRVPVARFPIPHAVGMITLPEKVRVTAPLVLGEKDFKVGAEMEMVITTLWSEEDCDVIGYKFKMG